MKLTHILLDMDGVLSDFFSAALFRLNEYTGRQLSHRNYVKYYGEFAMEVPFEMSPNAFWTVIDNENFWRDMHVTPWAHMLMDCLKDLRVPIYIATSPSAKAHCIVEKKAWLQTHFKIRTSQCMFGSAKHLMAKPGALLIDDYPKNVEAFRTAGGDAVCVPSNWNTLNLDFKQIWRPIQTHLKNSP